MELLSAEQVRAIIEKAGVGESLRGKVSNIAFRTEASQASLWNYMRDGAKRGPLHVLLKQIGRECGVLQ